MPTPEKKIYTGIDTWRGLAALMVCVYHFTHYQNVFGRLFPEDHIVRSITVHGNLGVYIFFVISGFVIPLSMFNGGYIYKKFPRFIAKRTLRIEPPYIATILLILLLGFYFAHKWGHPLLFDTQRFLAHVFYLVPFIRGMEWYNIIFWTLAVEFQFYLVCAILFPLWTNKNRWVRHISLLPFLLSAWYITDNRLVMLYAPIFGFGISLFLYRSLLINLLELALYVAICGTLLYFGNVPEVFYATVLAFGLLLLPDFKFSPGTWLGKISYSLYLTHGVSGGTFLMVAFDGYQNQGISIFYFVLALLIAIAAAFLFYYLIEKPFQSFSRNIKL